MFQRAAHGWELAKQSWHVLRLDKELLVLPVLSGIACLLVLVSFAVPLWATGFADQVFDERMADPEVQGPASQFVGYAILFAFYFVNYFVIVFFNSALIACAIIRFKGGDPELSHGFSAAFSRLPQIAAWAFVAATVGVLLRMIESRSERFGAIVASLLGMAWSAVTYFVVPIIVIENAGPFKAGKRSVQILKQSWGEALVANFGIGIVVFLATLVGLIPCLLGAFAVAAGMHVVGATAIGVGIVLILVVSLISTALNSIVVGALYLFAAEGTVPQPFDESLFRSAFVPK